MDLNPWLKVTPGKSSLGTFDFKKWYMIREQHSYCSIIVSQYKNTARKSLPFNPNVVISTKKGEHPGQRVNGKKIALISDIVKEVCGE